MLHKIIQNKIYLNSLIIIGCLCIISSIMWTISIILYNNYTPNNIYLLILSYLLGLKHALDADHIAVIDNVTNRLIIIDKKPLTVGLYFSLGHSTVVIIVSILLAILTDTFSNNIDIYNNSSDLIGSIISTSFLLILSLINMLSIYAIYNNLLKIKVAYGNKNKVNQVIENISEVTEEKSKNIDIIDWNEIYRTNSCFSYCFGKTLFKMIDTPWKMYFVGLIFGLGFDTAIEIALLGLIAIQSASNISSWIIIPLPILFTCGMTLIDTADGIIMTNIYGWGYINPIRKIYYNLTITSISCIFALFIGFIQLLSIIQPIYSDDNTNNAFWKFIIISSDKTNYLIIGVSFVGSFIIGFIISYIIMKYGNFQSTIEVIDFDNKNKVNNIDDSITDTNLL